MKIIIIGGVAAGMSAASKAKRTMKDAEITVYEKTDVISWGACGLPYYIGGFFQSTDNMMARSIEKFMESGIDVKIKHEVVSVDHVNKKIKIKNLLDGKIFEDSYDKLMVATGASAIIPPIKNVKIENVFTLKEFQDGVDLKEAVSREENKNIVIIGAGYIGIEAIEAMHHLGKNVRVIQLDDRVLPESFDKEITDLMEDEILSYQNISLHLGETVKELKGEKKVKAVITDKGIYEAEIVIIATGIRPNTDFIKETGIEMLKNGAIIIDNQGRSNIEDIYSAGDCATVPHRVKNENVYIPLATTANKIGRVVGENLAGKNSSFFGTLGSAAVKVLDLEAGRTGISETDAKNMNINYGVVFIKDKNQTNYYPGQENIYIKLIYEKDSKVILGGQIVGKKGAVLRIDVIAAAIHNKMTTEDLGMLDLCYAPPFARTWDALNVAGNVAK
ncbi:CoA-disulfide reductase [uncultured Ilyobacter sp.]|uniref:CoA-disulfide reductase n=1 Tax=uncultured Ilyobacter sp. TaxID=544433 RepID=UPI002AA90FF8|nr:CoA-disulfide reductase [uncultured Ilyobacter sp.]